MYDKTEELKKVLELDKEAIQSKLIEEKIRLDEENRIEEEKQKKLFYILITIIIVLLALAITTYTLTNDKKNSEKKIEKTIKTLEQEVKVAEPIINKDTPKIEKIVEKKAPVKVEIKEVIKIVEKEVPMSRTNLINLLNGKKFNIAKCYDYTNTTLKPTNTCKETLNKFFKENKDAIRFEVIGVIGEDDIKKASKQTENKKLKDYIIRGVARDRVIEASWLIKEVHKSKALVTAVNFYITSKKNNKGIIVRAYH